MKAVKSLSSFSNVSIQKNEMKKVQGGTARCYRPFHGNGGLNICPDHQ
jgi:hypothetical protein